jgi:hypothetical protein
MKTLNLLFIPASPKKPLSLSGSCRAGGLLLFLWAWMLLSLPALGQRPNVALYLGPNTAGRYLVLDKPGFTKRIRFYPSHRITFKLHNDPTKYTGVLQAVGDKAIIVHDAPIFLSEIRKVYYTKTGTFLPLTSGSLTGGGLLFALLGGINGLTMNNYDLLVPGAISMVAGQAIRPFYKRGYRIKGNRRLRAL